MINEFNIINPVINKKSPFFDIKRGLFYFPTNIGYRYYLECSKINDKTKDIEYYILLSRNKFNEHCKSCSLDNYGRCKMKPSGDIKNYLIRETKERGNVILDYVESREDYDIYNLI